MTFCLAPQAASPAKNPAPLLRLENRTNAEILNILLTADERMTFLRLDLPPRGSEVFENPGFVANMRVDCGLYLLFFPQVPLPSSTALTFCPRHQNCLLATLRDGTQIHIDGEREELVPAPGERPMCELSQFQPGMRMEEVCGRLPSNPPRDDNDAVIAALSFAGVPWSARLYPDEEGSLRHIELRRPLNADDLQKLVYFLRKENNVPWQAQFPGLDVDFAEMPQTNPGSQWDFLAGAMENFMRSPKDEATVMFAPAGALPSLADAEEPARDVVLFTLTLQPQSSTLLLDVAAYKGRQWVE